MVVKILLPVPMSLCFDGREVSFPKGECFPGRHKNISTEVFLPGHFGLLMPLNQQEKEVFTVVVG